MLQQSVQLCSIILYHILVVHARRIPATYTLQFELWYRKGTRFWQESEFGTSKHYGKAHGSLLSGQTICNHTVCCWPTTSSNISKVEGG